MAATATPVVAAGRTIAYCPSTGAPITSWCGNSEHRATVTPLTGPDEIGYLAGPFSTAGGDWISVADLFNPREDSFLSPGLDRITSFTGDAVDASGVAVPHPPLHMHHIHLARVPIDGLGSSLFEVQQHWLETHGDYQLYPPGSGVPPGYTTASPAGTCRSLGPSAVLRLFGEVNDIRPVNETTRIEWWMRIRLGLSPTPCRPISKIIFWFPIDDFTLRSRILAYDVGKDERLTWWTMRIPTRLRLAGNPWVHSHRSRYSGLLMLRNGPRTPWELAPTLPADCSRRGFPECSSLDALRSHMTRQALQLPPGRGSLYCIDSLRANTTAFASTPGGATIQIDLPGHIDCPSGRDSELQQGDTITVFAFTRAVYLPDMDPFQQHTLVLSHAELPPFEYETAPRVGESNETRWDRSLAVFAHPRPENKDQYGVWHLADGTVDQRIVLEPPVLRT
jgi:hypothetical protein